MKGCLNITVSRVGEGIDVAANRIGEGITARATGTGNKINLKTNRVGNGIAVSCGLVCSVNKVRYIRVEPKQIFLMPGNNFTDEVLIMSNVNWTVK